MSDTATDSPAAPPAASPVPLTAFPPALQKSLDPKSPLPSRMMAAKGIMMASPRDFLSALFTLTFDPDTKVVETAKASAGKLQDKMLVGLRDDDLPPVVLDFFARSLTGQDTYLEFIVLNVATTDESVAHLALGCSEKVAEIIGQNQLRILRDERIIRALVANPLARPSTKDNILDFCVRSGLALTDLPEYREARRRVLGDDPKVAEALAEAEAHSADKVIAEFGEKITVEDAPVEEEVRLTFTQRIMKMSVSQKIKLASLGNKEARTMLLRDSNKLVCVAAVTNPRITDGEIIALSANRTLNDDVMRHITRNREWLKIYQVRLNLVNNSKCPLPVALKLLPSLQPNDVKKVAGNRNVASTLQTQANRMGQEKARKS